MKIKYLLSAQLAVIMFITALPSFAAPARSPYCQAAVTLAFSAKSAKCRVNNVVFNPERTEFDEFLGALKFKSVTTTVFPDEEIEVTFGKKAAELEGQLITSDSKDTPVVCVKWKDGDSFKSANYFASQGYGLKLQFGKIKDYMLPGYIILRAPDRSQSFVEGYFYAKIAR